MNEDVSNASGSDPATHIQAFLVGGAVRDQLLGKTVTDRDFVVVGATPAMMKKLGFKPVGRDFPVFLHPVTGEEYALARTERKTAPGYHGFAVHTDEDVTLEDDLGRRDLTVNAMAIAPNGDLIDPYGGQRDLNARHLRHVSDAFAEDPVRILRVARFLSRFQHLGFTIAAETMTLMRQLVDAGEANALVAERVWAETRRALDEPTPSAYFLSLRDCGALAQLLPEIDCLFGVPQSARFHPEIDTGRHVMMVIDMAAQLGASNPARFAALCHDLGKGLTPSNELPSHKRHEERGLVPLDALCERLKVPNHYRRLARIACREHLKMHTLPSLSAATVVKLLENLGVFRGEDLWRDFAMCCEADARGRLGLDQQSYPQAELLAACVEATRHVDSAPYRNDGLTGPAIGEAIHRERVSRIQKLLKSVE